MSVAVKHEPHLAPAAPWVMDDAEFEAWAERLARRTGMLIPPERKQFLETNLRLRMRELGVASFGHYYAKYLDGRHGAVEWATLVDRLTVHETHFFRHIPSVRLIAERVLPEFATRARRGATFSAWSVGCSTGEEAYTLAMVIDHFRAESGRDFRYGVTGSDVSQPALAVARRGRFPLHRMVEVPPPYREPYCEQRGDIHFDIRGSLRERTAFVQLNLLDVGLRPLRRVDLIYCQNVLIYFPKERREHVMNGLVGCLARGGYLILGPGEMTGWSHPGLARVGGHRTLAFRRRVEEFGT